MEKFDELVDCAIEFEKAVAEARKNIIEDIKKTPKPEYIPQKEWDSILTSLINVAIALYVGAIELEYEIKKNKVQGKNESNNNQTT